MCVVSGSKNKRQTVCTIDLHNTRSSGASRAVYGCSYNERKLSKVVLMQEEEEEQQQQQET